MLATDIVETKATSLETWATNGWMRHVPQLVWMIYKVDVDVRKRLEKVLAVYTALDVHDPRHGKLDEPLRVVCRALDRLADAAKHARAATQPPSELSNRITWALNHAVTNLGMNDATLIARRFPFHTGERSKSEPLYGALLNVLSALDRLIPIAREIDPRLDERLLEGLVVLSNPVDDRMLKPIA
ncbi:MAG: hypothetical protein JJE51_03700 [Thermoanaerobaculia bacterium]|nr:hypothetical protein [Thermoanaerobaculia bacterium]